MHQTKPLRVLVIGPGAGMVTNPQRLESLKKAFEVSFPELPEPSDKLVEGSNRIHAEIIKFEPNLLVAGSRGGAYVARLIKLRYWEGATLLLGSSNVLQIAAQIDASKAPVTAVSTRVPVLMYHGAQDPIFPIEKARSSLSSNELYLALA